MWDCGSRAKALDAVLSSPTLYCVQNLFLTILLQMAYPANFSRSGKCLVTSLAPSLQLQLCINSLKNVFPFFSSSFPFPSPLDLSLICLLTLSLQGTLQVSGADTGRLPIAFSSTVLCRSPSARGFHVGTIPSFSTLVSSQFARRKLWSAHNQIYGRWDDWMTFCNDPDLIGHSVWKSE